MDMDSGGQRTAFEAGCVAGGGARVRAILTSRDSHARTASLSMAPAKASRAAVAKPLPFHERAVAEVQAHPTESALIAVSVLAVSSILGLLRKLAKVGKELKTAKEVRSAAAERRREQAAAKADARAPGVGVEHRLLFQQRAAKCTKRRPSLL